MILSKHDSVRPPHRIIRAIRVIRGKIPLPWATPLRYPPSELTAEIPAER